MTAKRDVDFGFVAGVIVLTFLLGIFGLLTIYSSQSEGPTLEPLVMPGKQLLFLLFGLVAMLVAGRVPFSWYKRITPGLGVVGYVTLVLVLLYGVQLNRMRGWFNGPGSLSFQPSELNKVVFVLLLGWVMSSFAGNWRRFWVGGLITVIWVVPICLQPDFGTAMVYFFTFCAAYWLVGGPWQYFLAIFGVLAAGTTGFLLTYQYAWQRILAYWHPESDLHNSGWHFLQFRISIAQGGLFGKSMNKALWSKLYLPYSYNDSVFATMVETLGVIGVLFFVVTLALLIGALFARACRMSDKNLFNKVCLGSIGFMLAFQSLLHISVNTTLLPATGLTLPLVSYGGSSLTGTMLLLGVALAAGQVKQKVTE